MIEVMEYIIRQDHAEQISVMCKMYCDGVSKLEEVKACGFWQRQDDPLKVWQWTEWQSEEKKNEAAKKLFSMAEMGAFSSIMASPPKRIGNFTNVTGE